MNTKFLTTSLLLANLLSVSLLLFSCTNSTSTKVEEKTQPSSIDAMKNYVEQFGGDSTRFFHRVENSDDLNSTWHPYGSSSSFFGKGKKTLGLDGKIYCDFSFQKSCGDWSYADNKLTLNINGISTYDIFMYGDYLIILYDQSSMVYEKYTIEEGEAEDVS